MENGAYCKVVAATFEDQRYERPIWSINYTIFHQRMTTHVPIVTSETGQVPELSFTLYPDCYFEKLPQHDLPVTYTDDSQLVQALRWLSKDDPTVSQCGNFDFIERYALVVLDLALDEAIGKSVLKTRHKHCTLPEVECKEGTVTTLEIVNKTLTCWRIPKQIHKLTNLQNLYLSKL